MEAIQKTLDGQPSTYGPALREVARQRLQSQRGRQLPPEAGVRNSLLTGDLSDADFEGFSAFLDDLSVLENQAGKVNPALLLGGGAAVTGGAIGGLVGETPEERLRHALLGAGVGVGAGLLGPRAVRLAGRSAAAAEPTAARIVGVRSADGIVIPTTGRKAAQPGTPLADPMRGVDVFLEKFAPEFREGIKEAIERNGGFQAQRRGAVSQADVEALAQAVAVDVSRRVKPGTALNVEAIRSHVDALATAQWKVNELAAKVARGQNTDADVLALEAARAEVSTIAASVMGARSEAGRALSQWRTLARVIASGNPKLQAEAAGTLRGEAAQFAGAFAQLPPDPVTRLRWLQQHETPTFRERARQYFMANVLS
jgi:hypothetical protein